ncbi:MAG: DNA repair protein RadC [Fusobacteria bacterium]|nr:MAG: DNA repair protein RadC [Fusobacteriota bacterium]KAF0230045.1 MAG: DNA repair protein [Fusobacteriota bacterium]
MEKKKIKDMPKHLRPRERSMEVGINNLSDQEVLAIIIRSGYREHTAIDVSMNLLHRFGSIKNISQLTVEELCKIKGIGKDKSIMLKAAFEIGKRSKFEKIEKKQILSSKDASIVLENNLRGLNKEHFIILMLNTKNFLLGVETVSIGSLNSSIVHPRELFKSAINKSAAAIILAHNHPSGDATPSREDIEVTKRIKSGGQLLGIDVIDHIIIGDNSYYSFKEEKMI